VPESSPLDPARLAAGTEGGGGGAISVVQAPLLLEDGHTVDPVVATVRAGEALLGYITDRRTITASPEAMRAITELVGEGSRVLVGNAAGDVWTDLRGIPVDAPPAGALATDRVIEYARS